MAKNKWTKVGAVIARKKEQGGGTYIKLAHEKDKDGKATGNLKKFAEALAGAGPEGLILNVADPRTNLDEAVKNGRMDQEKADYLKSKIPDFVKFEIHLVEKLS